MNSFGINWYNINWYDIIYIWYYEYIVFLFHGFSAKLHTFDENCDDKEASHRGIGRPYLRGLRLNKEPPAGWSWKALANHDVENINMI